MGEDYDSFMDRVKEMPKEKQRELFKTAARHIELEKGEVEALLCFCTDPNGIPYKAENLGNLNPEKIVDIIVEVCLKIAEIKVDMVTDSEKKN